MPRQRKSTYRPPSSSRLTGGSQSEGSRRAGGSDSEESERHGSDSSHCAVPETPPSSSKGSTSIWGNLPDDGCPFTEIVDGAKWDGKLVLFPNGRSKLWPPQASSKLSEIIRGKREMPGQGGEKWSKISDQLKHQYFDELRKTYFIPNRLLPQIWPVFETLGSDLYKHMVNDMKRKGVRPVWCGQEEWELWEKYWKLPWTQQIADQNRENRLTESSDGTGVAMHHYGSRAVATDYRKSVADGEEKSALALFKRSKLKNGRWVDSKSEATVAEVERQLADAGDELTIEEQNRIFLAVNPMDNKGRVYVLGSFGYVVTTPSYSASQPSRDQVFTQQQVSEMVDATVEARLATVQEEHQQQMEENRQQMERFRNKCRHSWHHSITSHPHPHPVVRFGFQT